MSKKILIVNIGTEIGGIEKSLINFLNYLDKRNCDVDLLFWKPAGPMFSDIPDSMHVIKSPGPGSLRTILACRSFVIFPKLWNYGVYKICNKMRRAWKALPKLDKKYDIAISYCQNGISPYYVIDKVNATRKYMFYHHGSYEKKGQPLRMDKQYYSKFTNIIAVSESGRKMLLSVFPELIKRIITIHNLINEESICRSAKEDIQCFSNFDRVKICTVGRLSPEKGQMLALQVAKKLVEKGADFEWVFVGDGPLRKECEEFIQQQNLENNCMLVGAKNNPYPFIAQANIYVQTSYIEADPITIHEAKVLNKKIVASSIPSIIEALSGYVNYEVCELDIEHFRDTILQMLQKKEIKNVDGFSNNQKNIEKFDTLFTL